MAHRSLVIGASGQVGEHCLAALRAAGAQATGTYHQHARPGLTPLDITDRRQIRAVIEQTHPDVIYLTACVANVDECEVHPEVAWRTNVLGVQNAVEAANESHSRLVFFSSEYVFDGTSGPYRETSAVNPLSEYGRQKVAAEHLIATTAESWLIVRTAGVYSWESQGKNFLYRLLHASRDGTSIRVPADQISTPTYAPDLVRATIELAERTPNGIFNVSGGAAVNRYEFALAAARHFELDARIIEPVTTADLGQTARRPLRAGLIVEEAERALGRRLVDFDAGLREMARADRARELHALH